MALAEPIVSLGEAQAFVRVETGEEEAILAGLIRTASALCEAFLNQVVIARPFAETVPASRSWQRLTAAPVRSIDTITGASNYEIDIDASGTGWVRVNGAAEASRLEVAGVAGMCTAANDVPEPIRQGVLRLVGHLFASRDGAGGDPPAAVTALWRPYRRVRVA